MVDDAPDVYAKLTTTQAARYADVTPQVIVNWRKRGHLPIADHDDHGHPRYTLLDVAKAEHKMARYRLAGKRARR